ncbi:parasitic phase-specific protein PSP-1 [Lasiosphaeria miniovina]|uniref:Parasitic phase-specific protein PSP-1 n=1 Tax=Lasiosphaeria miniovina TaxID=1954250 RepID=A0AA40ACJ8_9PEZI|nr:parasitic phase-specific protein PSP-1 [Lasiosphaeria miniovina]KAK0713416.1 parasitic phase-specific protein PSP-1 [Lasiosphaeria miniovina]
MSTHNGTHHFIAFGKNANCTLDVCPVSASILEYQPSIPGNAVIIGLFGLALLIHVAQGAVWRSWTFMICMVLGCVDEMIGYAGRIMLNTNPFSFNAFVIQVVCITTAPVFFCSSIYVLLTRTINNLDRSLSRFNPKFFVWIFIPCDIFSLILQAAGGALSSVQAGTGNKAGVRLSMVGLAFQVVTLVIFVGLFVDYVARYVHKSKGAPLPSRIKIFLSFLLLSILFILVRCVYRIDELSDGYDGPLIHDEKLFVGLESVMMLLAVFCLNIAHPGIAFGRDNKSDSAPPLTYQTGPQQFAETKNPGTSSSD